MMQLIPLYNCKSIVYYRRYHCRRARRRRRRRHRSLSFCICVQRRQRRNGFCTMLSMHTLYFCFWFFFVCCFSEMPPTGDVESESWGAIHTPNKERNQPNVFIAHFPTKTTKILTRSSISLAYTQVFISFISRYRAHLMRPSGVKIIQFISTVGATDRPSAACADSIRTYIDLMISILFSDFSNKRM